MRGEMGSMRDERKCRLSGFSFQFSVFRFQISDFRFQISDFRFQFSIVTEFVVGRQCVCYWPTCHGNVRCSNDRPTRIERDTYTSLSSIQYWSLTSTVALQ